MTDIQQALRAVKEILPAADSWAERPQTSFAILERTGSELFFSDDEAEEEFIRGRITIWSTEDQAALQDYDERCAARLREDGWCMGAPTAASEVISGVVWRGITRGIMRQRTV